MKTFEIKNEIHRITNDMSRSDKLFFATSKKKVGTYIALLLFLGGIGAHHFYLERTAVGVFSVLFFWTGIPAIIALVNLFTCVKDVHMYNLKLLQSYSNPELPIK